MHIIKKLLKIQKQGNKIKLLKRRDFNKLSYRILIQIIR